MSEETSERSDANSLSKGEARAEASRTEEGASCVPGKARAKCGLHRKARGSLAGDQGGKVVPVRVF